MAWTSVITNSGASLINRWAQGADPIQIVRASGGSGTVPESALLAQTSLKAEMQSGDIVQIKELETGTQIKLQFPATEQPYTLHQIGLFAESDGGEVLLAIFQNQKGVSIPDASENPNFLFSFYAVLGISNEAAFDVAISPGASVTMDVLEDALSAKADLENGQLKYSQIPAMDSSSLKKYIGI